MSVIQLFLLNSCSESFLNSQNKSFTETSMNSNHLPDSTIYHTVFPEIPECTYLAISHVLLDQMVPNFYRL